MIRIAALVSGGGSNLQCLIDEFNFKEDSKCKIELVISSKEDAYALKKAEEANIKNICLKEQGEILKKLIEEKIDLVVLAGYLSILSDDIIKEFPNKIINIHPSLIPAFCGKGYYGMKVHRAVFNRGVKVSGATVHFVDIGVDSGPIILQKSIELDEDWGPEEIQKNVLKIEHEIFKEAIKQFCDGSLEIKGSRVYKK